MNALSRWIASATAAALLAPLPAARAFSDGNAALKEAAADRSARVVVTGKAAAPVRTVWVPPTAKSLDGFKPVLPADRAEPVPPAPALARADVRR